MLQGADDKFGIACLGGECFGQAGAGFLRFSCAEPNDRLQQALDFIPKAIARTDRLAAWLEKNPQHRLAKPYPVEYTCPREPPEGRSAGKLPVKHLARRTLSYVKPVTPFAGIAESRGRYCPASFGDFCSDGFPLTSPGLVPGFFLAAMRSPTRVDRRARPADRAQAEQRPSQTSAGRRAQRVACSKARASGSTSRSRAAAADDLQTDGQARPARTRTAR